MDSLIFIDARDGAGREAKEGRNESHKNIIAYHMHKNGFIGVHGGFLGWGMAWHHAPGLPLLPCGEQNLVGVSGRDAD